MKSLYIAGSVFFLVGISMIVFRKSLGVGFCRLGKSIFSNSLNDNMLPIAAVYDEAKAPTVFLVLGIINVVQSPIFFILGLMVEK